VFLDATEAMSAKKYSTFMYVLPLLCQIKLHLSKDDLFSIECPEENVKNFIENYGTETFMPSVLSTLETIRLGMLDELKKRSKGMTIDLCWTTILDPRCQSLKHLNQSEIQAAKINSSKKKKTSSFSASAAKNPDAVAAKELLC
jgi:hypothetical protein